MKPRHIILLRQVEGPRWCVTERALADGNLAFVRRIATARPYSAACQAALDAAAACRIALAIQPNGERARSFNRATDMVGQGVTS